jgi:hypothetical protein
VLGSSKSNPQAHANIGVVYAFVERTTAPEDIGVSSIKGHPFVSLPGSKKAGSLWSEEITTRLKYVTNVPGNRHMVVPFPTAGYHACNGLAFLFAANVRIHSPMTAHHDCPWQTVHSSTGNAYRLNART